LTAKYTFTTPCKDYWWLHWCGTAYTTSKGVIQKAMKSNEHLHGSYLSVGIL
jgi:hypothetical protein